TLSSAAQQRYISLCDTQGQCVQGRASRRMPPFQGRKRRGREIVQAPILIQKPLPRWRWKGHARMIPPKELRASKDRKLLTVTFPARAPCERAAEMRRVLSPSPEVEGRAPQQRVRVPGRGNVAISGIARVGSYAGRSVFVDVHETGIFP